LIDVFIQWTFLLFVSDHPMPHAAGPYLQVAAISRHGAWLEASAFTGGILGLHY